MLSKISRSANAQWSILFIAIFSAYAPMFLDLARTTWRTDQNSHGPIVLGMATWYFIHRSRQISVGNGTADVPSQFGWVPFFCGVMLYVIGMSQDFHLASSVSLIMVLAGLTVVIFGFVTLKRLWFAFFFLVFLIPLPGAFVDALTQPLKSAVSWGAVEILYFLDYPVSRSGVIIIIGPYQLLVADACAGLNSLFTLEALGLMYMNIIRHQSVLRNVMLATFIVPISITSNLIRVILLSLVTFHYGDEAGQGFVHDFSGMILFLTALLLIIGLDSILRAVVRRRGKADLTIGTRSASHAPI